VNPRRWPIVTDADRAAIARVLDRGVLSGAGAPEVKALETEFAAAVGARCCLATNSGTSALHIALAAAGVGPGDEVIVPALSFIATAQAVLQQGATPVFADVDPDIYNIDPADAARRVTSRTRAIVPVHLHGLPADMDAIEALARGHRLTVIEDAAQAHGAVYKGRAVGTLAAMAAFSLNSTKNLPAGEGGLFVTDSEELYARAARVRFDGLEPPSKWDPTHPLDDEADAHATLRGWMYLPGELTSALARSQLQRLAETTARSQRNAARLSARLATLPGVEPPRIPPTAHMCSTSTGCASTALGRAPGSGRPRCAIACSRHCAPKALRPCCGRRRRCRRIRCSPLASAIRTPRPRWRRRSSSARSPIRCSPSHSRWSTPGRTPSRGCGK